MRLPVLAAAVMVNGYSPRDYYFSGAGNDDSGDGSIGNPYKTIAKANTIKLINGGHKYFAGGEAFAGKLLPTEVGSGDDSTKWPVYDSYGVGMAIIDGSGSVGAMYLAPTAHRIRVINLDFTGSTGTTYGTVTCQTSYIKFYNCKFRDSAACYGFAGYDWEASGANVHDVTLEYCAFDDNHLSGCAFGSSLGTLGPHDILISHCSADGNGTNLWLDHGIYLRHGGIIEYCTCTNNAYGAGIKTNCEGVHDSPYTPIVRGNTCYGNYLGIVTDNVNGLFYNNKIYDNELAAIDLSTDAEGAKIYFNTLANSTTGYIFRVNGLPSGVDIQNNLLIQDAAVHNNSIITAVNWQTVTIQQIAQSNTWDYNTYYHDGSTSSGICTDTVARSWTDWTGYGAEAHGTLLAALPDLTGRYTDWQPIYGNLVGKGVAIEGYETDIEGTTREATPTPGAYVANHIMLKSAIAGEGDYDVIKGTFTIEVSATDYAAGWTAKVNGVARSITGAARRADKTLVDFTLTSQVEEGDTITLEYDADSGDYADDATGTVLMDTTPALAVTNAVKEYLFVIDHSTGDLTQWSGSSGADISCSADAGMGGDTNGLKIVYDDTTADYVWKTVSPSSTRGVIRGRIYFDPNSLTMGSSDNFRFGTVYNSGSSGIALLDITRSSGNYTILYGAYTDAPAVVWTSPYTITDAPHYIEFQLTRASSAVAADGTASLWIDGTLKQTVTGIDNYDRFNNFSWIQFGANSGLDATTSGTFYIAHVQLNDSGLEIGA